jgi:hypothetical protein
LQSRSALAWTPYLSFRAGRRPRDSRNRALDRRKTGQVAWSVAMNPPGRNAGSVSQGRNIENYTLRRGFRARSDEKACGSVVAGRSLVDSRADFVLGFVHQSQSQGAFHGCDATGPDKRRRRIGPGGNDEGTVPSALIGRQARLLGSGGPLLSGAQRLRGGLRLARRQEPDPGREPQLSLGRGDSEHG